MMQSADRLDELLGVVITRRQKTVELSPVADFRRQDLAAEAAQRGVSAVVERFGATEKRSFAACVFLDQKVFRTREYIFGAISLGPNCFVRDRTSGLKSWTRGLPSRTHSCISWVCFWEACFQ